MILITRLREDNKTIQKNLSLLKIKSLSEPIYKIKFLSKALHEEENKIFIVVSKQTVRAIKHNRNFKQIKKSVFVAVGKQTSLELKRIGLNVKFFAINSSDLISKIKKNKLHKQNSFEYLCGNYFNKDFMTQVRKLNKKSKKNVLYNIIPNKKFSKNTLVHLRNQKVKMVLLFSKLACKTFLKIYRAHKLETSIIKEIHFLSLSKEIAQSLKNKKYKVSWARSPQLQSLLKKVSSIYPSLL